MWFQRVDINRFLSISTWATGTGLVTDEEYCLFGTSIRNFQWHVYVFCEILSVFV